MENNNNFSKQNTINILRWIGILPAATAGFIVGPIIINTIHLLNRWFIGGSNNGIWTLLVYYLLAPAIGSLLSVYWGTIMAPKIKKFVAMIIFVLLIILHTITVLISFMYQYPDAWWFLAGSIISIFAAGYIVYRFFVEGEDFNLFD